MKIEVLTTQWAYDGGVLPGGVHDVEKPSKLLLEQAALAESVGSIKVSASAEERAKMKAAIQPDSESLKHLEKAQSNSTWHEGNLDDYVASKSALLADQGDLLDDEARANLEVGVAQAKAIREELGAQKTKDYDAAVRKVLGG